MTACEYRKADIVKYFLNDLGDVSVSAMAPSMSSTETMVEGRLRGCTALHIAAAHNSADILNMLIKKDCPLAIQDELVRCVYECVRERGLSFKMLLCRERLHFTMLKEVQALRPSVV